MLYYKVIKEDVYDYSTGYTTLKNELLTKEEKYVKFPRVKEVCFRAVDINLNDTYIFFGARFER